MNQRIFELVEKAELYQPGELMTNWDEEDYVVSPEELKKFAQLIIQECASVLHTEMYRLDALPGREVSAQTMETAALLIKNHFGVK